MPAVSHICLNNFNLQLNFNINISKQQEKKAHGEVDLNMIKLLFSVLILTFLRL